MLILNSLLSGSIEGLLWALLAMGVYISYRVLDFADLGVEGSIITGSSVTCLLIVKFGWNPFLATFVAIFAGGAAGLITGVLHTKLKIAPILSGILTMTALYSINIRIMGSSSITISGKDTIVTLLKGALGLTTQMTNLIVGLITVTLTLGGLYLFFGTQIGSSIRATGSNERMCRAQGINTDNAKILGLVLSNAVVAFAGAILVQCIWSTSNYSYGVGTIVIGLASIIIGETIFGFARSFWAKLLGITLGAVIYRAIITLIISTNFMSASDLKLVTAIVVAVSLSIPTLKAKLGIGKRASAAAPPAAPDEASDTDAGESKGEKEV